MKCRLVKVFVLVAVTIFVASHCYGMYNYVSLQSSDESCCKILSHSGSPITDACFSPSGNLLMTCGEDQRFKIWRTHDGCQMRDEQVVQKYPIAYFNKEEFFKKRFSSRCVANVGIILMEKDFSESIKCWTKDRSKCLQQGITEKHGVVFNLSSKTIFNIDFTDKQLFRSYNYNFNGLFLSNSKYVALAYPETILSDLFFSSYVDIWNIESGDVFLRLPHNRDFTQQEKLYIKAGLKPFDSIDYTNYGQETIFKKSVIVHCSYYDENQQLMLLTSYMNKLYLWDIADSLKKIIETSGEIVHVFFNENKNKFVLHLSFPDKSVIEVRDANFDVIRTFNMTNVRSITCSLSNVVALLDKCERKKVRILSYVSNTILELVHDEEVLSVIWSNDTLSCAVICANKIYLWNFMYVSAYKEMVGLKFFEKETKQKKIWNPDYVVLGIDQSLAINQK